MFWTRLGSSVVLVVLALIFLISGGPVLGAVCLLLSLTAYCELIKACHVEKYGKFTLLEIMGGCGIVLYGAAMMLSKNFLWGIGAIVLMFLAVMFVYVFHFPKYPLEGKISTHKYRHIFIGKGVYHYEQSYL